MAAHMTLNITNYKQKTEHNSFSDTRIETIIWARH